MLSVTCRCCRLHISEWCLWGVALGRVREGNISACSLQKNRLHHCPYPRGFTVRTAPYPLRRGLLCCVLTAEAFSAEDCSALCAAPKILLLCAQRRKFDLFVHDAGDCSTFCEAPRISPLTASAENFTPHGKRREFHPSQRSAGDLHPSQRNAGDLHPSKRSAGDLHPSKRSAGDCCVWLKKSSEPPFTECCER